MDDDQDSTKTLAVILELALYCVGYEIAQQYMLLVQPGDTTAMARFPSILNTLRIRMGCEGKAYYFLAAGAKKVFDTHR